MARHVLWIESCALAAAAWVATAGGADKGPDWIGKNIGRSSPAKTPTGSLLGEPREIPGAVVREVKLDAAKLLPETRWSADGKHVFMLDRDGMLLKVSWPALRVAGRLALGWRCANLCESALGLLAALDGKEELWIVDPATLAVKRKIPVPALKRIACWRGGTVAVARIGVIEFRSPGLMAVDLSRGKALPLVWTRRDVPKRHRRPGDKRPLPTSGVADFEGLTVSPDGKYVLCGGGDWLYRMRLVGARVTPEEACWLSTGSGGVARFYFSPDGRYLALHGPGGRIYRLGDLSRPAVQLRWDSTRYGGHSPGFAFDKAVGKMYGSGNDREHVVMMSRTGRVERTYCLGRDAGCVRQILAHPGGARLLVLTERKAFAMALRGRATEAVVSAAQTALAGRTTDVKDARVTEINIPIAQKGSWFRWSADGEILYVLHAEGRLRKIRLAGLRQEAELQIGSGASWLEWSAVGLVTYSARAQELIVVDPEALSVAKTIRLPACQALACARPLSKALLGHGDSLQWVDLRQARTGRRLTGKDIKGLARTKWADNMAKRFPNPAIRGNPEHLLRNMNAFFHPVIAPDGRCLLTGHTMGQPLRFRIAGEDLYLEQQADWQAWIKPYALSPDGVYLARSEGRYPVGGRPGGSATKTAPHVVIYLTADLQRPIAAVRIAQQTMALAVDSARKAAYVQVSRKGNVLTVCAFDGKRIEEYRLPGPIGDFVAHPRGRGVLAIGQKRGLWWVRWAEKAGAR